MAERIVFQFDDNLDYQQEAILSVVELFRGMKKNKEGFYGDFSNDSGFKGKNRDLLGEDWLLENLRYVQKKNHLFPDESLGNDLNFTVEMETGTGKTYVYLRTLLELHREYGFKKFIIAVPSIAIRKGVEKTVNQLQEHFQALYGVDLKKHSFVYDSTNPKRIQTELVESPELCICIMNIQAFNKDTNKIRSEDEWGNILWKEMQFIRPIVIMDEPQKMEGDKGKKSKSLIALEDLNPLFTLRYSATHKQLHHVIYKLDSFAAYQKHLVKAIQVKTVRAVIPKDYPYIRYLSFSTDLKANIELFHRDENGRTELCVAAIQKNTSLFELSGEIEAYRNMRISQPPHKLKPLRIESENGDLYLTEGSSNYELSPEDAVRIQIQLAIKNHFEKQLSILKSGKQIKALTLFFVDSVEKVRNEHQQDGRGIYLRIFDEEYEKAAAQYAVAFQDYQKLFPEFFHTLAVREGYFALDRKKRAVEVDLTGKIKAKSQEDIDRGIELILEKKDELISFESPLAFIFSHSALREGWDNPNVFTLCTLKSGGSDIAKKQEIGRGLRLPVDINGNQCHDSSVNGLTVIANDYYDHFASALQADFNSSMNYNPREVTMETLYHVLSNVLEYDIAVTDEIVLTLKQDMIQWGILSDDNLLIVDETKYKSLMKNLLENNAVLMPYARDILVEFESQIRKRFTRTIQVKNGDQRIFKNDLQPYMKEEFYQQQYHTFCSILSKRTLYKSSMDKKSFILRCQTDLNKFLEHHSLDQMYHVETGIGHYDETGSFQLKNNESQMKWELENMGVLPKEDKENVSHDELNIKVINDLMVRTLLPRRLILEILRGVKNKGRINRQEILEEVAHFLQSLFQEERAAHILEYEVLPECTQCVENMFNTDFIWEEELKNSHQIFCSSGKKTMHKYYRVESKAELEFAEKLDFDDSVCFFTRIDRGSYSIDTPYGDCAPTWLVVCKDKEEKEMRYFMIEWEAKDKKNKRNDGEKRIHCAKLHLEALKECGIPQQINYLLINGYMSFVKERYNVEY